MRKVLRFIVFSAVIALGLSNSQFAGPGQPVPPLPVPGVQQAAVL